MARLSPVSITIRIPSRWSRSIASAVVALIGSETPMAPIAFPFAATNITVWPSDSRDLARSSSGPSGICKFGEQCAIAESSSGFVHRRPVMPLPVNERKSATSADFDCALLCGRENRSGQRMLASALKSGCDA